MSIYDTPRASSVTSTLLRSIPFAASSGAAGDNY